ncbi:FtsW/RodA/SpoVE family cell cycle protein [Campylobacter hominis]|uniref:FtsW/RodA/SpoVE family cell cycle protein n=1 Tax=Campylobacter hominis TaxID=76517 RepID=UPI001E2C4288|nr:FtsW/RodA/SpoVE family cell cycle protein [Campylobacter hominis]
MTEFLSEDKAYQVKQSVIAIGNGGLAEKMQVNSHKMHFKFLSVAAGDFIFAYIIKRFGF